MTSLNQEMLRELLEEDREPKVSIYLPTHPQPDQRDKDRIRLKNAVDEALDALLAMGLRRPDALAILQPTDDMPLDPDSVLYERGGAAIFLAPGFDRAYDLPAPFDEHLSVGRHFYIRPLLPLLTDNGRYFILALSQNEIRLLEATRDSAAEIPLGDTPTSMAEALQWDDPEKRLQYHVGTGRRGEPNRGGEGAMYHGHGGLLDEIEKENVLRYFQKVDHGLQEVLAEERAPLVLAGVEYLAPIFRQASAYEYIHPEEVTGNPEELSPDELCRQAWELVEPRFKQAEEEAKDRYHIAAAHDQGIDELAQIVPAAQYGKVDTLFVATDAHQWGTFDAETGQVKLDGEGTRQNEDLLDRAVGQTFLNGGAVYALPQEEMPTDSPVAAIFRY